MNKKKAPTVVGSGDLLGIRQQFTVKLNINNKHKNNMNITKEMTSTNPKCDFLRFQVGRMETRPEKFALYDGKRITGYRDGSNLVSVFRLLGFGSTLQKAEQMAKRAD